MKRLIIITFIGILLLAACGRSSSPDGRSQIRDEKIQREIDSLKDKNKMILDSISIIDKKLTELSLHKGKYKPD